MSSARDLEGTEPTRLAGPYQVGPLQESAQRDTGPTWVDRSGREPGALVEVRNPGHRGLLQSALHPAWVGVTDTPLLPVPNPSAEDSRAAESWARTNLDTRSAISHSPSGKEDA